MTGHGGNVRQLSSSERPPETPQCTGLWDELGDVPRMGSGPTPSHRPVERPNDGGHHALRGVNRRIQGREVQVRRRPGEKRGYRTDDIKA